MSGGWWKPVREVKTAGELVGLTSLDEVKWLTPFQLDLFIIWSLGVGTSDNSQYDTIRYDR